MNQKRLLSIAAMAALSLAAIACGSSNSNNNASKSAATQAPAAVSPATGGSLATAQASSSPRAGATQAAAPSQQAQNIRRGGTLNLATPLDAKSFDPMVSNDVYSGYVVSQVFEGLVLFDQNIKPVGNLADSWDISPDGLTYTFHLHHGVKFQDGTDFNAAAMKFSMDRIRNNKASVGYSDCGPDTVSDTKVVDDYTFQVLLVKPYAPFLTKLTSRCGAAVSPTAVQKLGDDQFGLHPVGTGPFKFGEWVQGDHFSVVKNDNYWKMGADGKPLPYLNGVTWKLVQDDNERLQGLLTGEFDIGIGITEPNIPTVKQNPNMVVQQQPGFGWTGFMLVVNQPPFNNKLLAQAVAFAINRDDIIKTVYNNLRDPQLGGVIPPPLGWAIDPNYKPYTYDPNKAKALMAQAGMPNGFTFTLLADTSSAQSEQLYELVQSQLKAVGITMNIQSGDFNQVVIKNCTSAAGVSGACGLTISGGIDPDSWTYSTFHTGGPFNVPHLSDPMIDQLTEQGRAESDINKRGQIYQQVNKLIMDYSPWIMIANMPDRFVGNKKVQGWHLGTWATVGYSEYWMTSD